MIKRLLKATVYNGRFWDVFYGVFMLTALMAGGTIIVKDHGWLTLLWCVLTVIGMLVALPFIVNGLVKLLARLRDWTYKE